MHSWPHAPSRQGLPPGAYFVTAGAIGKRRYLSNDERLDVHLDLLFACAAEFGSSLEAWAVMANHYHFVAHNSERSANLETFLGKLHSCSGRQINKLDGAVGRKVWYSYRDTHLTFEKSYLARLNYVHTNPVKHGLVRNPRDYRWCSAEWFFLKAERPFYETVCSFKIDQVNVDDDYG